ncbi:MAG: efflux RND transporter periplasmic adaptor subunit [Myxococcales bacterium]
MAPAHAPERHRNRGAPFRWAWVAALCALPFALAACGGQAAPKAPPPPTVLVDEVETRDVKEYIEAVAVLDGYVNAEIRARVSGYLESQKYQDGARVKTGQLLFTIDPSEYSAQASLARGNLERAKAARALGQTQLERQEQLVQMKATPRQAYDEALAAKQDATGQETAAKASLEQAEINLSYTQIRSPVDGVAGVAQVRVGNLVGKDGPTLLTTVSQIDPMRVRFSVAEVEYIRYAQRTKQFEGRDLAWAQRQFSSLASKGTTEQGVAGIELVLADGSVYPHQGVIISADREIDPATATIGLECLFPNPDQVLRPGQYGRVRIQRPDTQKNQTLVVAEKSLIEVQGTFSLAVVGDDNVVQLRPVEVGARVDDQRVIKKGVSQGERVVVEGIQKVKDGSRVVPKHVPQKSARLDEP